MKIIGNELLMKVALVIFIFCCTFLTFKALQKPAIYNITLKNITHTYNRDVALKDVVWRVDAPYYYIDSKNSNRWDGGSYSNIKKNYYNTGDRDYGFFPLFPIVWNITGIDVKYIGLFNYLMFGISVILLSNFFFRNGNTSMVERLCVFVVSLVLPWIVIYYMPYAEALFTFIFALAVYGLIKNKYWLFFISIMLFAMTRPIFAIVGLSFVIMDVIHFINHKNPMHFIKELWLKLAPLLLGTFIVFFMFYLNSGSFMKYFESLTKYWNSNFSIPTEITDWSIEAFVMNVFAIFFILIPSSIIYVKYFMNQMRSQSTNKLPSIFSGDTEFIKSYFFYNGIVYFWGIFTYVIFFQAGALNGISRYIIASPFFFIFLFYFYSDLKEIRLKTFLTITIPLLVASLIMLISQHELEPAINFNDSGYFTFLFTLIYLFSFRFINNTLKVVSLAVLAVYNIIWITYLYNIYLCDGWIFT
ncbi:MAG: hypothetical protein H0W84_07055 [Bacteroidetes bacterium]|nr:hypothetical protein [Bacteroidota bacterium]